MSRFHASTGALRPVTLSVAGVALATVAVVAIAAMPGRPAAVGDTAAAAPSAASAVPSAASAGSSAVPAGATPTLAPTPVPTPTPARPVTGPEDAGTDAIPLAVDLDTFDGHAVSIDVVDRTGSISAAVSGRPGDGASVEADTVEVTNVDARTLRLRWIDYPIANRLALFVDEDAGHLRLLLIQPEPIGTTDAIGFDRELLLTFDRAIDASTVEAFLQDGLDTAG